MKIVLKNVTGESITIDVKPNDTFRDLKSRIHNESGVQLDLEQLNFKGKKITDDQIVSDYFFDVLLLKCKHWLLVCRRLDLLDKPYSFVSEHYAICSDHFIASQFTDESKQTLKKAAIPTVFEFNNQAIPVEIIEGDQIIIEDNSELLVKEERLQHHPETDEETEGEDVEDDGLVRSTDPLPKQICISCANKLNICHEFAEICLEAEAKLRELDERKHFRSREIFNTDDSKGNVAIIAIKSEQDNKSMQNGITYSANYFNGSEEEMTVNRIHELNSNGETCKGKGSYCCPLCCDGNMSTIQNSAGEAENSEDIALLKEIGAKIIRKNNMHGAQTYSSVHGIVVRNTSNQDSSDDSNDAWDAGAMVSTELEIIQEESNQSLGEDGNLHAKEDFPTCRLCGETFASVELCLDHAKCHMESDLYPCSLCELCFTSELCLVSHCEEHKAEERRLRPKATKRLTCPNCLRRFNNPRTLAGHNCHSATRPFKCTECGKFFRTEARLEFHQQVHDGGSPVICEHCGKEFSRENNLFDHVRLVHMREKAHRCEQCGKSFQLKARLIAHQRVHTGERPFVCDICGGKFYDNATLKGHRVTHMDVKPFQCDKCGRCFARKTLFKQHVMAHMDEGKSPKTSHSYYQHMWIHQGKKPYPCEYCGKAFRRSNGLKIHIRIHTGEKPHSCDICGRGFAQKQDMKKHRNLHVQGKL
ncbi:hypothetical protein C0J52_12865 [Blattella germanica]|nr:hypothetical protein C0J52_12865 [Blattella germanica]